MTSRQLIKTALSHHDTPGIPIDFGSTSVTGIHVLAVEHLRNYFGLEKVPVKVTEPYQMLGELGRDLREALGIDTIGITPRKNMFGITNDRWKEFKTFWGQVVLVPGDFNTSYDDRGDLLIYPEGDMSVPPSGRMPRSGFFFDSIVRQPPLDDTKLSVEDNLEEFSLVSEEDLAYWKVQIDQVRDSDKAVVANFGGTALGDIALVPGPFMKHPKGIRDIAEWYMSTVMRQDFVHELYERQTAIALANLEKIFGVVGNEVDVVFLCGTDFGTQDSQFCSVEGFEELWLPYYRKINGWIHTHTSWKTFKHSCGAVRPLLGSFIKAGFDIINPVQINAAGMIPQEIKDEFGSGLVFWGGGVDTQKVLSFGSPLDVEKQITENCRVFGQQGGFVFNTVHNVQANVPPENLEAMVKTLKKINGS
jgi:hypothetical protein